MPLRGVGAPPPGARRQLPRPGRRPIIPLQVQHEVEDQPVYRRPEPVPTPPPRTPTPSERTMQQEGSMYEAVNSRLLESVGHRLAEIKARGEETALQTQLNKTREQMTDDRQRRELETYREGFRPKTPSAHYLQAAAFRGKGDIADIEQEAMEAEGKAKMNEFGRWYSRANPIEQQHLKGLSVGLIKEGMQPERYQKIFNASKADDDSVYEYEEEEREKANRILQASFQDTGSSRPLNLSIPGERAAYQEALPQIPTDRKREGFLESVTGGAKQLAKGAAALTVPFAWDKLYPDEDGKEKEGLRHALTQVMEPVSDVFEGEQRIVTPVTRPAINWELERLHVPEVARKWIDRHVVPYIMPSTFVSPGALKGVGVGGRIGLKTVPRLSGRAAIEGTVNMLQGDAAAEIEGRERSDIDRMIDFGGGAVARGGLDIGGPTAARLFGKALRPVARAARRAVGSAPEAAAPVAVKTVAEEATEAAPKAIPEATTTFSREGLQQVNYRDLLQVADQVGAPRASTKPQVIDNILERQGAPEVPPAPVTETRIPGTKDTTDVIPGRYYHGTTKLDDADALGEGAFLTPHRVDAEKYADLAASTRAGEGKPVGPPRVIEVDVDDAAVRTPEDSLAGSYGSAKEVVDPQGVRVVQEAAEEVADVTPPLAAVADEVIEAAPAPKPAATGSLKSGDEVTLKGKPVGTVQGNVKGKPGYVWVKAADGKRVSRPRSRLKRAAAPETPETPPAEPKAADAAPAPSVKQHKVRLKGTENTLERLAKVLQTSKRLKGEARATAHRLLEERLGHGVRAAEEAVATGKRSIGDYARAVKGGLKGKRNLPLVDPPLQHFTDEEVIGLSDLLREHYKGKPLTFINADEALQQLLHGYALAPHQVKLLEAILPDVKSYVKATFELGKAIRIEAIDIALNGMRLLQSGVGDVSTIFRHGGLAISHTRKWSRFVVDTVKSLFNGDYVDEIAEAGYKDADFDTLDDLGLDLEGVKHHLGVVSKRKVTFEENLTYGEGKIMAWLSEHAPIVKQTSRAFRVPLALLRLGIAKEHLANMRRLGYNKQQLETMATVVNGITGRGNLANMEKYAEGFNLVFYAARWQASRFQVPAQIFNFTSAGSGYTRMLAARTMISSVALAGGTLALAKAAGADIDVDPRSTNFGKVQVGPVKIDVTGGFGPMMRLVYRVGIEAAGRVGVGKGESVMDALGQTKNLDLNTAVQDFLESKLSPAAGAALDLWQGENFKGEKLRADWATVRREALNRATPLFIQSLVEAYREGGWESTPYALGEMVGLGVTTYTPAVAAVNDLINDDIERGHIDVDTYPELEGKGPRTIGELHAKDKHDFKKRNEESLAEITKQYGEQDETAKSEAYDAAEDVKAQQIDSMKVLQAQLDSGGITKAEAKEGISSIKADRQSQQQLISSRFDALGLDEDVRPEQSGLAQNLFDYGAIYDKYPHAAIDPDEKSALLEELDTFRAGLAPEAMAELDDNMNVDLKEFSLYQEYEELNQNLSEAGYFDLDDRAWFNVVEDAESRGTDLPDDYYKYLHNANLEAARRGGGVEGKEFMARNKWLKQFKSIRTELGRDWASSYEELVEEAIDWGYAVATSDDDGRRQRQRRDTRG